MKELTIIDELKTLLPPLTETEFTGLEESLLKDGCLSPLVVWNNILVDGHHRYEICCKHQIPYAIKNVELDNLEHAKLWAWQHQENRRNLTTYHRTELALRFKSVIEKRAAINQSEAMREARKLNPKNVGEQFVQKSAKTDPINTRNEIAHLAGVSHDTVTKVEYISEHADEETKSKLRRGDKGTSINKEYQRLKPPKQVTKSMSSELSEDFVAPMGLYCRPGEKPAASGKYYVPKSNLGDLPHDQPEILVAQLMAHFPRDYTQKIPHLIFDALRANDGNTITKQLAGEIWHEYGKK
jgi:hypothetical protein